MLTGIDLFCGIGGFRIGMERHGIECVLSSDIDKFARQTYRANFGDEPQGDIRELTGDKLPDFDFLTAGFPCQPFSSAGKGEGFRDKTRGTLFFEVARILEEKRPKAFLLENVSRLEGHDEGKTFRVIIDTLDSLDYAVFWTTIDANLYVPQHRKRIYIVGFDRRRYGDLIGFQFQLNPPRKLPMIGDILEAEVDPKYTITDHQWAFCKAKKAKNVSEGKGWGYNLIREREQAPTLTAHYHIDPFSCLIYQGEGRNPRGLTPRECARLMGFDDSFKIVVSDRQAYKQFGNSVVVPLVSDLIGGIKGWIE